MDFVKNLAGGSSSQTNANQGGNAPNAGVSQQSSNTDGKSSSGFWGGISDKLNTAGGGGRESEKNEDYLDKGVDFVQEKFMGQGPQDNESAVEQAKDEQISDYLRSQFKSTTGRDIPIKDKPTTFDRNTD